jgi:ABC-type transport system involved in multi-copper enzyme maturation permease subunit
MAVHIPEWLGGPVLEWELRRASRKPWSRIVYYGWAMLLAIQTFALGLGNEANSGQSASPQNSTWASSYLETRQREVLSVISFSAGHLPFVLREQFLLIVLLAPILAAGALGYEKEQNTLLMLFHTELQSREIVTGKVLGRLAILAGLVLIGLPVLVFLTSVGEIGLGRLFLALLLLFAVVFAIAGLAMLASVWTRRTADAVVGCYSAMVIVALTLGIVFPSLAVPHWLNVLEVLDAVVTPDKRLGPLLRGPYLWQILLCLAIGTACSAIAAARLRTVCINQIEWRPHRRVWGLRPAVTDSPIRWREFYVIGLAPLPGLRTIPRWVGMLCVFGFSTCLAISAVETVSNRVLFQYIRQHDWQLVANLLKSPADTEKVAWELAVMGLALLIMGVLAVAVRGATGIPEEIRRKTWDELCLTRLSLDEIVQGKQAGILLSAFPYVFVYGLPMIALGALARGGGVAIALVWLFGTSLTLVLVGLASVVVPASVQQPSPWLDSALELEGLWTSMDYSGQIPYPRHLPTVPLQVPSDGLREPQTNGVPARNDTPTGRLDDPDLERVIAAWPSLSISMRRAIMVLLERTLHRF